MICTQRKKSSGKFSLPNYHPLTDSASGQSEARCKGRTLEYNGFQRNSGAIQNKKHACVNEQMNNFYLGLICSWTTHKWKRKRQISQIISAVLGLPRVYYCPCLYIQFFQDGPCAWSSSAGFSRSLAWVRITCGKAARKLWSCSYLQAGTFHF